MQAGEGDRNMLIKICFKCVLKFLIPLLWDRVVFFVEGRICVTSQLIILLL